MGEILKHDNHIPEDMIKLGKTIDDIAAAGHQIDTEIHMVSDSIDVMADTSDSLSDYTAYLKEKAAKLKKAAISKEGNLEDIVNDICELIDECNVILFGFVEMSHGIQNFVREIADEVDEITESTDEVSDAFKELTDEVAEIV